MLVVVLGFFFPSYIEVAQLAISMHSLRDSDKKEREISRTWCLFVGTIMGKSICSVKCIYHHPKHSRAGVLCCLRKWVTKTKTKRHLALKIYLPWKRISTLAFHPLSVQIQTVGLFTPFSFFNLSYKVTNYLNSFPNILIFTTSYSTVSHRI